MEVQDATFVDGQSARVETVTLVVTTSQGAKTKELWIRSGDRVLARWPVEALRRVRDIAEDETMVLRALDAGEARLTLRNPTEIAVILREAANLDKAERAPRQIRKALIWAGGAVASVLVIVFVIVPALAGQLAVLIPPERERQLGEAAIGQLSWVLNRLGDEEIRFCEAAPGLAALDTMTARLRPEFETPYDLSVRVIDHPMVNAFAAPGGNIVIFRGLIDKADMPEEVAGVLAHEMAHVVHRDPTRLALQSAGTVGILGLLIGDFSGGAAALVLTERLIAASYSQDAEARADMFAVEVLAKAGLPSTPLGTMFDRLREEAGHGDDDEESVLSHLASHPDLRTRAMAAREADVIGDDPFTPVLSGEEWAALQAICGPKSESDD